MGQIGNARCLFLAVGCFAMLVGCVTIDQERAQEYNEDGVHLFRKGDYSLACESFKAALALEPENTDMMYNLAECYDRQGKTAKAEHFYRECLQRVPNHPECRHGLTSLLVRSNRRPEAVLLTSDWMAREPKLAAPYAEDGWLWFQAGDLPRAQARLQQAIAIDPQDKRALTELAQVYEAMNRQDRALVLYERILERNPKEGAISDRVNYLITNGVRRPQPD